ncbi:MULTISPECIES: hypothetical protein [unclassified Mycoplasma]|uniref:hypothetical protein n=1 Tax=unclassified Mycoplasma TaxID=2683645 RepID=UPI002B1DCB49|nr:MULTISPECIES: hypothetical protein [unclassified Mycoplasma]MEA4134397.1 hypothetical protein [Mycoplasma sp. 2704]MEA4162452.1 hypothetical protein [Mycoplasma sp. 4404]MEA4276246.1 hypothetical protein [Mycoplasma sp. 21DD0573]
MSKNKHVIILINGKRRSGKGLLSNELSKQLKPQFEDNTHILSFAQPIKQITQPILDEINWNGQDKEIVRPLWIAMGEVGRNIDTNIWCSRVFEKIKSIASESSKAGKSSLFIIDDLRFPNELEYFKGNINSVREMVSPDDEVKIVSIRIEKYFDPEKFVKGVDDNSTETSFDKLVNISFDHIVPQNTLIDWEWKPIFANVDVTAKSIIRNFVDKPQN